MDRRINKKNTIDMSLNGARVIVVEDNPLLASAVAIFPKCRREKRGVLPERDGRSGRG